VRGRRGDGPAAQRRYRTRNRESGGRNGSPTRARVDRRGVRSEGSWHKEDEPIDPRSVYAKTKAEAEKIVLAEAPGATVARVNFFGFGAAPGGLAAWVLGELRAGRQLNGFVDVYFSPFSPTTLPQPSSNSGLAKFPGS